MSIDAGIREARKLQGHHEHFGLYSSLTKTDHAPHTIRTGYPLAAPGGHFISKSTDRYRPQNWIEPPDLYQSCYVTTSERKIALETAREDLLKGKRPVKAGKIPHLILTIGAPGAGKSTISEAVATHRNKTGDYITIDIDVAVKYHPRYLDMWNIPSAINGEPSGVGITTSYLTCNYKLEDILIEIYEDILHSDEQYNIILQSHNQINLIGAKIAGYKTTLLFVGVPLNIAIDRSRVRAIETGKFLAESLSAQDTVIYRMWSSYRSTAAWYGLWADEFLIADNGHNVKSPATSLSSISKKIKSVRLRGESWEDKLYIAQKLIDRVSGV